jgi:hypothetical protein
MRQLDELIGRGSNQPVSIRNVARRLRLAPQISVRNLLAVLEQPSRFRQIITTPAGTALGGWVELELRSDGSFTFSGHMHDSGWDPYDFRVMVVAQSGPLALAFQHSGHVDGTGSDPLGSPDRDHDWNETGTNPLISANWLDARTAAVSVSKSYEDVGIAGNLEEIAKLLTSWWITGTIFGPAVAVVVVVGSELGDLTGIRFADVSGLAGLAAAGATILVLGPNAIVPALAAGIAGAITVKHRKMSIEEKELAALVFGDTLPTDRVVFTNLFGLGGRKFTMPSVDSSILVNLGDAYDNPSRHSNESYPTAGQLMIHELTHAWQIVHTGFMPGLICEGISNQVRNEFSSVYNYRSTGKPWSKYNLEQQGSIVDSWFRDYAAGWTNHSDVRSKLERPEAVADSRFGYIANNVRLAQG